MSVKPKLTFDQASVDNLVNKLSSAGVRAEGLTTRAVQKNTEDCRKYAQILVPKDTFNLMKNIKTRYEDGGMSGIVYVDTDNAGYGYWVENGNSRMGAREYMKPSHKRYSERLVTDLSTEYQKIFR